MEQMIILKILKSSKSRFRQWRIALPSKNWRLFLADVGNRGVYWGIVTRCAYFPIELDVAKRFLKNVGTSVWILICRMNGWTRSIQVMEQMAILKILKSSKSWFRQWRIALPSKKWRVFLADIRDIGVYWGVVAYCGNTDVVVQYLRFVRNCASPHCLGSKRKRRH